MKFRIHEIVGSRCLSRSWRVFCESVFGKTAIARHLSRLRRGACRIPDRGRLFGEESGYYRARFRALFPGGIMPGSFGIVTACNPGGCDAPPEDNARRTVELERVLEESGLDVFPVTGGSEDFSHSEPGFGVVAPESLVVSLGSSFGQDAVFFVERGRVWLVCCSGGGREEVGLWETMWIGPGSC